MNRPLRCAALLCSLSFSLLACAEAPVSEQVALNGDTLTLQQHAQHCALQRADGQLVQLQVLSPCSFSTNREGLPRVEKFNDDAQIVIVYHAVAEPAPDARCTSLFQAVRLLQGKLEASRVVQSPLCMQMQGPIDQKNFVAFFDW